jgi:hypothetical protein
VLRLLTYELLAWPTRQGLHYRTRNRLFANVFPAGLTNPAFGPQPNPPDPFLMAEDVSAVVGVSGTYQVKFQSTDTLTVYSGSTDIILSPLDGTKWSRAITLDSGWSIGSSAPGAQLYTFKRIVY